MLGFLAATAAMLAVNPLSVLADSRVDPRAAARKGQELLLAGRYAEAARELAPAAAAMQRDEWLWGLYGKALFHSGELAGAREAYRHVLRLSPADVQARMMLQRISMFAVPDAVPVLPEGKLPPQPGETERSAQAEMVGGRGRAAQGVFRLGRLVLDPGHGGNDPGLIRTGAPLEKLATLDLALRVRDLLSQAAPSLPVFLTRSDDRAVTLAERALLAERMAPDLVLSLHVSGGGPGVGAGFAVWADIPSGAAGSAMAAQENAALGRETSRRQQEPGIGEIVRRSLRVRGAVRAKRAAEAVRAGISGVVRLPETQGAPLALPGLCAAPCALLLLPGPGGLDLPEGRVRYAAVLAEALAVLHREGA